MDWSSCPQGWWDEQLESCAWEAPLELCYATKLPYLYVWLNWLYVGINCHVCRDLSFTIKKKLRSFCPEAGVWVSGCMACMQTCVENHFSRLFISRLICCQLLLILLLPGYKKEEGYKAEKDARNSRSQGIYSLEQRRFVASLSVTKSNLIWLNKYIKCFLVHQP